MCPLLLSSSYVYGVIMYQNSTTYILYLSGHNTSTPKTATIFAQLYNCAKKQSMQPLHVPEHMYMVLKHRQRASRQNY